MKTKNLTCSKIWILLTLIFNLTLRAQLSLNSPKPNLVPQQEKIAYPKLEQSTIGGDHPTICYGNPRSAKEAEFEISLLEKVNGRSGNLLGGFTRSGVSLRYQGKLLDDIVVLGISTGGVTVSHSEGLTVIPLDRIPPPISSRYKKELQSITAALPEVLNREKQQMTLKKQFPGYEVLHLKVTQVLPNGLIANAGSDTSIFLEIAPQGFVDQQTFSIGAYPNGIFTYTSVLGANRTLEKWTTPDAIPLKVAAVSTKPTQETAPRVGGANSSVTSDGPSKKTVSVEESKQEAVRRYPDLGVAGSRFNREFVSRHQRYQRENTSFLENASWPIRLAEEIATSIGANETKR